MNFQFLFTVEFEDNGKDARVTLQRAKQIVPAETPIFEGMPVCLFDSWLEGFLAAQQLKAIGEA